MRDTHLIRALEPSQHRQQLALAGGGAGLARVGSYRGPHISTATATATARSVARDASDELPRAAPRLAVLRLSGLARGSQRSIAGAADAPVAGGGGAVGVGVWTG
jgi:hypothetical protein